MSVLITLISSLAEQGFFIQTLWKHLKKSGSTQLFLYLCEFDVSIPAFDFYYKTNDFHAIFKMDDVDFEVSKYTKKNSSFL